jgi:hypothetical protein
MIMASKQTALKKAQPDTAQMKANGAGMVQAEINAETPKRSGTKMEKATAIYLELVKEGDHKRADFIKRFVDECGLTKAGSSTYLQVLRKRHKEGKL